MERLRGRAAELAAVHLKKGVRGNTTVEHPTSDEHSKDTKVEVQHHSSEQQKPSVKLVEVTHPVGPAINHPLPQLQAAVPNVVVPQLSPLKETFLTLGVLH